MFICDWEGEIVAVVVLIVLVGLIFGVLCRIFVLALGGGGTSLLLDFELGFKFLDLSLKYLGLGAVAICCTLTKFLLQVLHHEFYLHNGIQHARTYLHDLLAFLGQSKA